MCKVGRETQKDKTLKKDIAAASEQKAAKRASEKMSESLIDGRRGTQKEKNIQTKKSGCCIFPRFDTKNGGIYNTGDEHSSTNCAHCAQVPRRTPAGTDRCCWTNTSQERPPWLFT